MHESITFRAPKGTSQRLRFVASQLSLRENRHIPVSEVMREITSTSLEQLESSLDIIHVEQVKKVKAKTDKSDQSAA